MYHIINVKDLNPTISFIGAGKVATALGIYFKQKGIEVSGYISQSVSSAEKSAVITESKAFANLSELLEKSNVIWITTPDDKIESVAKQIASTPISNADRKLIVHASGVHTANILASAKEVGYQTAAAHPLLAFSNSEEAAIMLHKTWFAVEETTPVISSILRKCGNHTFEIEGDKKTLYHAAACMLSNYMVTLMDASQQMLAQTGLSKEDAASATMPLLESVVKNMQGKNSKDALTGPIKRGDASTVSMHINTLQEEMPKMVELYKMMGKMTMHMINDYKLKDILD